MTRSLPPLDVHAHLSTDVAARELEGLGAVVLAATRSMSEYESVVRRSDLVTVWGLGCHPGVGAAQDSFDAEAFADLLITTPLVSEVGLDGRSPVSANTQAAAFTEILELVRTVPRIVSVHSAAATGAVIDHLETAPITGVILHWWLGDEDETARAVRAGCYFSVNHSMVRRRPDLVASLPRGRVLIETDHPDGDRQSKSPRQPGSVADVEKALASTWATESGAVRAIVWRNFANLVAEVDVGFLMPPPVAHMLQAASELPEPST